MATFSPKRKHIIKLSSKDAVRMNRLLEEVSGRVNKEARIMARVLGKRRFTPRTVMMKLRAGEPEFKRICDGRGNCVCYDYVQQICYPC